MATVRTRISVAGYSEGEVRGGLPHLLDEFRQRPWLLKADAFWDADQSRLVVVVEAAGDDPRIHGGHGGANFDEVWDCVFACIRFSSEAVRFDVEESVVVPASD